MTDVFKYLLKMDFIAGNRTLIGVFLAAYGLYAKLKGLPLADETLSVGALLTGVGLRFANGK